MAKYHKNPNFQKCEPSQKKIAFKEAYQQVRTLIDTPIDVNDPKAKRTFEALSALVGQMKWNKAEVYFDALRIVNRRASGTFEESTLESRRFYRDKSIAITNLASGEGKLPA